MELGQQFHRSVMQFLSLPLHSHLFSEAVVAGLQLPENFLEEFTSSDAAKLLDTMKATVLAAATISPLVILVPSKWADTSIALEHFLNVGRPWLIGVDAKYPPQILYALGNERPAGLREVEEALWSAVMRLACGSSAEKELKGFLDVFDVIQERWHAQGVTELHLDFFHKRKPPFYVSLPVKLTCRFV
jgi:hypothetical protein